MVKSEFVEKIGGDRWKVRLRDRDHAFEVVIVPAGILVDCHLFPWKELDIVRRRNKSHSEQAEGWAMRKCWKCGGENDRRANYCSRCTQSLDDFYDRYRPLSPQQWAQIREHFDIVDESLGLTKEQWDYLKKGTLPG